MRLSEMTVDLPNDIYELLLKIRKGAVASFDTKKTTAILSYLEGWSIEKVAMFKPSLGGWVIKELPGANFHRAWRKNEEGRIVFETHISKNDKHARYDEDLAKARIVREVVYPKLVDLSNKTQTKWNVRNVAIDTVPGQYGQEVQVSFDFLVKCNVQRITSPDGQVFEVFGDYKNGCIGENGREVTYVDFFKWAVEHTELMDQVLALLNMEPHEKKHDAKTRYVPPPTASEEEKKVFKLLTGMTDDIRVEQHQKLLEEFTSEIEKFQEFLMTETDKNKILKRVYNSQILSITFDSKKFEVSSDWKPTIEKLVTDEVTIMQNMFVYKNTRKLGAILTAKGNMLEPKVLRLSAPRGIITGTILFKSADGSSFEVDNTVVRSWAPKSHRMFLRFPTTFHDVKMPDGSRMGQPSEERMNTIWAKA